MFPAPRCRSHPEPCRLHTAAHGIAVTSEVTDRVTNAIRILPSWKRTTVRLAFSPMPANPYAVSRAVSAAAKVRLAACDGMNPQDLVLLAHDLFEAFTGRHVKWLRYGLGFMLRQSLEGRGTKSVNPGGLSG